VDGRRRDVAGRRDATVVMRAGSVLFLIPARGGSRRIPGKNLRLVGGIPLVGWAARIARAAAADLDGGPHRVVCTTDDPAIAAAATAWGAEVLDRPAALATDDATSVDVALQALDVLSPPGPDGSVFSTLVLLQPTSPLTAPADVVAAVRRHWAGDGAGVTSVVAGHPATWHMGMADDGTLAAAAGVGGADVRLSGGFYVVRPEDLRRSRRFVGPGRTLGQLVAPERAVDIDEPVDLLTAEALQAALAAPGATLAGASGDEIPGPPVRKVTVLTTGRQDWGILHSTCAAIRDHPDLELDLVAGGMHLSRRHGRTIDLIRADGFDPSAELAWLPDEEGEPEPPAADQAAAALAAVARHLAAARPDAVLLAGDRFETAAAAIAATVGLVPIAHLHGGEQTLGAFDDALRHAITKLSHLHLTSTDEHARRVVAMGEDPRSVFVVGSPGLDALARPDPADRAELSEFLGLELAPPVVIVSVHPATLDPQPAAAAAAVAAALDGVAATYVITLPNVDPGGSEVARILAAAAHGDRRVAVSALGERRYWGLLRIADAIVGNSSSGINEAPAVSLPAVNVGDRQAGRQRVGTVIDVPADAAAVADALRQALAPAFREAISPPRYPTIPGRAGQAVADIIARWRPSRPPRKPPIQAGP
jgi:UDP-hydrolysing UDP-N-acetyl-D-glucosamine 2-epimerase